MARYILIVLSITGTLFSLRAGARAQGSVGGDQNVIGSHAAQPLPDLQNRAEAASEPIIPANLTYEEIPLPPSTHNRSSRPPGGQPPATLAIPAAPAPSGAIAGAQAPASSGGPVMSAPVPGSGNTVGYAQAPDTAQAPGVEPGNNSAPSVAPTSRNGNNATFAAEVKPEALCAGNIELRTSTVTRFASECRAYLYKGTNTNTLGTCTAWFIDSTHMVLAGHCVAVGGSKTYSIRNIGGAYGLVCCSTSASDTPTTCATDARFYITTAITTLGWYNSGNENNDGAVIKVSRYSGTNAGFGVPLSYGSMSAGPCGRRAVQWGGYPSQSTVQAGCNNNFQGRFRFTAEIASPSTCPPNDSGQAVSYPGSACPGMSGGRLIDSTSGLAVGILARASISCTSASTSIIDFVQLVNSATVPEGVYLSSMVSAIP